MTMPYRRQRVFDAIKGGLDNIPAIAKATKQTAPSVYYSIKMLMYAKLVEEAGYKVNPAEKHGGPIRLYRIAKAHESRSPYRIAGTIRIGRGSFWGAGLV